MTSSDESSADRPADGAGHSVVQAAERILDRLDEGVAAEEESNRILPDNTRLVRWAGLLFLGCATILLPWIVIAAITLPSHQLSENYDVAWAGYDVGLFLGLVSTAVCTLRRSARLPIVAAATGALLGADAWFDVLTSPGGWDLVEAVAMSVLAELPLATACIWLAMHSQDVIEQRLILLSGRRRRR
ncbi:MAG: hypothetical protein QOI26_1659 [Pseudonocardiales bacterium]|nr:hypothetical protein [Pseudonocardiales bacterium]